MASQIEKQDGCDHGYDYIDYSSTAKEKMLANGSSDAREDSSAAYLFEFLVPDLVDKTKGLLKLFNLRCRECCRQYLVNQRKYGSVCTSGNRVQYRSGRAEVRMYVDFPHPAKKGVVKVDKMDGEHAIVRPVQDNNTYQFYMDDEYSEKLSDLYNGKLRREAIRVDKIDKAEQLDQCFFHYCDAALLELWRESEGKPSLKGICYSTIAGYPDNAAPPTAAVKTLKQEPMDN